MRNIATLLRNGLVLMPVVLLAGIAANAQPRHRHPYLPDGLVAGKGSGVGSRLISSWYAMADNAGVFATPDSTLFHYPSSIKDKYDYCFHYRRFIPGWNEQNMQYFTWSPTFYTTIGIGTHYPTFTNSYVNVDSTIFTLNAAGKIVSEVYKIYDVPSGTYIDAYRKLYTLNAANAVTYILHQEWYANLNTWMPTNDETYTLNAQNIPVVYVIRFWNTNNNTWQGISRNAYSYDVSGLYTLTDTIQQNNSNITTIWSNSGLYVYTNNAAGQHTSALGYFWNGAWSLSIRNLYTYDVAGNILSCTNQGYQSGTYSDYTRYLQTFNSYNQITSYTTEHWDTTGWMVSSGDRRYIYYYEPYTATGITSCAHEGIQLTISPNPANNTLHLSLNWDVAQGFTGTLTDMQGRVVQQFSAPAAKQVSLHLSVKELPAGNYHLNIKGDSGGAASRMINVVH